MEDYNLKIVLILTIGFALASLLGFITQKMKISPILGYLTAGFIIGPYSPGFVADLVVSEQLAEIGVILMMFGVGLHFKWEYLVNVRRVAIPGAIGQTLITTIIGTLLVYAAGWSIETGIIVGLAVAVASTVVLVRILDDKKLLNTSEGHVSVGWLIVEDILTVAVLILIPYLAVTEESLTLHGVMGTVLMIALKFSILAIIMFTLGRRIVSVIFIKVARTRSHELFTLTVLAMIFVIATGSSYVFGTSMALGAFIAGMVIGQTDARHQASANALPIRDAFVVIFFITVGMLFNPNAIIEHFLLFIGILGVILIVKPIAAFVIIKALKYPYQTAITVAIALAQIGEFSFILTEEAMRYDIIPDEAYDIIVACALISISINPALFNLIQPLTNYFKAKSYKPLSSRLQTQEGYAIIIGYGPIGRKSFDLLEKNGFAPTVIDNNVDTITSLAMEKHHAIYGDATHKSILEAASIENASLVVITVPDITITLRIIDIVQQLNPRIHIIARANYTTDVDALEDLDVEAICTEEVSVSSFEQAISSFVRMYKE